MGDLDQCIDERPDHAKQQVEAYGPGDRVGGHGGTPQCLSEDDDGREPEEQGAEDEVHRGKPAALDEVLHPSRDERGRCEQEAGDEQAAVSAHGPDRRDEDGRDRDQEDRVPEALGWEERVGHGQEQERDEENGVAHWLPAGISAARRGPRWRRSTFRIGMLSDTTRSAVIVPSSGVASAAPINSNPRRRLVTVWLMMPRPCQPPLDEHPTSIGRDSPERSAAGCWTTVWNPGTAGPAQGSERSRPRRRVRRR